MKRTLFFLQFIAAFLLFSSTAYSQLNWAWAKDGGYNDKRNAGYGITGDANGNSYVTGYITTGSIVNGQPIQTYGSYDGFVAKYDVNGNLKWMKVFGGAGVDAGKRIKADKNGNLYLCGHFEGPAHFGSIQVNSNTYGYFFVAKMDTAGNFIWVRHGYANDLSVDYYAENFDIDLDASGNVYFNSECEAQKTIIDTINTNMNPQYFIGPYILKFDHDGNVVWSYVKQMTGWVGSGTGWALNVGVDNLGNVYMVDAISRTDTSGSGYESYHNLLITKFDSGGQFLWHKEYGDSALAEWICWPGSLEFDQANNFYVGGCGKNKFLFDQSTLSGYNWGFLAKFDTDGEVMWAKQLRNTDTPLPHINRVPEINYFANSDSLYCAGFCIGPSDFDGIPISANGNGMIFVACYDTSGSIKWLLTYGNNSANAMQELFAATFSGKAYLITGVYTSPFGLDSAYLLYNVPTWPNHNFFVASTKNIQALATPNILSSSGMNFSVYPNPASTSVTVRTEDKSKSYDMTVYSSSGQAVYEQGNVTGSATFNTDRLASGNYFIQLNNEGQTLTKRFVVSH